jgi:predicted dehydrogenase
MAHFINVLQGKEEAFVKPEESLALQKILDAIYESSRTRPRSSHQLKSCLEVA